MGLNSRRGRAARLAEQRLSGRTSRDADFLLELHASGRRGIRYALNRLVIALGHAFGIEERGLDCDPSGGEFRIGMDVDVDPQSEEGSGCRNILTNVNTATIKPRHPIA